MHNISSSWSPYDRGLLFHNFFINYYVNQNKTEFIKFKKNVNNLNLGKLPHILLDNKYHISYDDIVSFEEIFFLKKNIRTKTLNIIEIGPGYGRGVEYILKNFDVGKYFKKTYLILRSIQIFSGAFCYPVPRTVLI
jgi:hypothetical protein